MDSLFSRSGDYFASCSGQEDVKVWKAKTSSLHQKFGSSLRGVVTCLAWSKEREVSSKRRRSQHASPLFIAGGLGSKVIVWDIFKDKELLLEGHDNEVTCVDWDQKTLYSGSKDQHVFEWNVETGVHTKKWKADKVGVQCICCYGDGSALLTAGRAIKLWSLQDYTLLKRVSGHASAINGLAFVSKDSFLSSACNERVINYWKASLDRTISLATLTCEEEIKSFACVLDKEVVKVAVVSGEGNLFHYRLPLSNFPSEPVAALHSISYVSSPPKPATPAPLPVLAVIFPTTDSKVVTVAYSSNVAPAIESIDFDQPNQHMHLVRAINPGGLLMSKNSNLPVLSQSDKVTVVGPGNMAPQQAQLSAHQPLSQRIAPEARKVKEAAPSADSLTQLLVQSVGSGDDKLMEEVLRVSKEKVITSTVQKLPVQTVLPFMKKLTELLQHSPSRGLQLSVWIKSLLTAHASYLMTVPQLSASLNGLHQLLEARVNTFSRLCMLQGKLDLMIAQGEVKQNTHKTQQSVAMTAGMAGESDEGGSGGSDVSMTTESPEESD